MELKGRIALISGSTSGIGLGIAHVLASAGADIALNGFGDPAAIEATRQELATRHNVRAIYVAADVTKATDCAAMVSETERQLGRLDILVNNAGIQFTAPVEAFPVERWDAVIATNLSAAFYLTRAAIPGMRARGWGRVINIASAHGLVASVEKAAYVAAKHGIIGLTKVVGLETANAGITVNAICPGWVLTPLVQSQIEARAKTNGTSVDQETTKLLAEKQPMHAFSTPEQIGAATRYFCSDMASTITGTHLSIDGGWTAQ